MQIVNTILIFKISNLPIKIFMLTLKQVKQFFERGISMAVFYLKLYFALAVLFYFIEITLSVIDIIIMTPH